MTKNQISTVLIKELALQVNKYHKHSDKVDMMISDAVASTSKKLGIKPSEIFTVFNISTIKTMLPISFYNEVAYLL